MTTAIAQLKELAVVKGYRPERAFFRDKWYLINEATGNYALTPRGTPAIFLVMEAVRYLRTLPDRS